MRALSIVFLLTFCFQSVIFADEMYATRHMEKAEWYTGFANTFSSVFIRNKDRLTEVFENVRPSIDNSTAAARYDSILNRLLLKTDYFWANTDLNLKPLRELEKSRGGSYSGYIFHEISHAEFDILIEEQATTSDSELWQLLNGPVKSWFKTHYPSISANSAVNELFGNN